MPHTSAFQLTLPGDLRADLEAHLAANPEVNRSKLIAKLIREFLDKQAGEKQ